jgi:ferredoxin-NADP reductase
MSRGPLESASLPMVWRVARVVSLIDETPRAKTIRLHVPEWPGHRAGQHVDVRLTAQDGYQTERSYSIASAPEDATLALTVERIDDGEVSPYLTEQLRAGDELELGGPIGGPFTWRTGDGGPLLLIGGGSGLVPLMAMLRHRAARSSTVDAWLLVWARSLEDVFYRDELAKLAAVDGVAVHHRFTDHGLDAEVLSLVSPATARRPRIFVSGPTGFVGRVADLLVQIGHDPAAIRIEDFGPAGG